MKTFCTITAILSIFFVNTLSGGSWQDYVDEQLVGTGHVEKGIIIGLDGNPWASTGGFSLKAGEGKAIVTLFDLPAEVFSKRFIIDGVKYMGIIGKDRSIYGKKGAIQELYWPRLHNVSAPLIDSIFKWLNQQHNKVKKK